MGVLGPGMQISAFSEGEEMMEQHSMSLRVSPRPALTMCPRVWSASSLVWDLEESKVESTGYTRTGWMSSPLGILR